MAHHRIRIWLADRIQRSPRLLACLVGAGSIMDFYPSRHLPSTATTPKPWLPTCVRLATRCGPPSTVRSRSSERQIPHLLLRRARYPLASPAMSDRSSPPRRAATQPRSPRSAAEVEAAATPHAAAWAPPPVGPPDQSNAASPWDLGWLHNGAPEHLLPPPVALQAYAGVHPDAIERIMAWADAQSTHRQAMERQALERWAKFQAQAQFLTAAVAAVGLLCAAAVGIWGSPVAACIIALAAVGGPATARALAHVSSPGSGPPRGSHEDGRPGDPT